VIRLELLAGAAASNGFHSARTQELVLLAGRSETFSRARRASQACAEENASGISLIFKSDANMAAQAAAEVCQLLRETPDLSVTMEVGHLGSDASSKNGSASSRSKKRSASVRQGRPGQVAASPEVAEILLRTPAWLNAVADVGEVQRAGVRLHLFDWSHGGEVTHITKPTPNTGVAAPTLVPGTQISHYRIRRAMGSGGMGLVFEAEDLNLKRIVALKFLLPELLRDANSVTRFRQEARAASALNHPNICTIYEINESSDTLFIAMERLEGETLRNLIKVEPLPVSTAVNLALDIIDALDAVHSHGIVHRDLKPSNILVTKRGAAKVLDFGLAKLSPMAASFAQPEDKTHSAANQELTSTGATVGSVNYMSPEQVRGETLDSSSDLFSFGSVLYEMVTGQQAFPGKTWGLALDAVLNRKPPAARSTNAEIPPKLDMIIQRLLEKDRHRRYTSAYTVRAELQSLRDSLGSSVRTRSMPVAKRQSKAVTSIAVLPFENAAKDEQSEYLSEGITDSIIDILSRLPKLRVMARSTVFRHKAADMAPVDIGQQLSVNAVLCGRLSQIRDRLVVRAELVDVNNGSQLWGEHYSRHVDDILQVQEEIAREISSKLKLRLTGEEKKRIEKRVTKDTDAYKVYLQGRHFFHKRTERSIRDAIGYFHKAILMDPTFALAHCGLADCYATLSFVLSALPKEHMTNARAAATRALEIDPGLAEAHASKAMVTARYDWNLPEAEREFHAAIELRPGYAWAHQWYGECLTAMERFPEAIEEMKTALSLDPLSSLLHGVLGGVYFFARQYDLAIESVDKALKLEPGYWVPRLFGGMALQQMGDFKGALEMLQDTANISHSSSLLLASLGNAYAAAGMEPEARRILTNLVEASKRQYVAPLHTAFVALGLYEDQVALGELEKAVADRNGWLMFMRVDPRFDRVRQNPRFHEILYRTGIMREHISSSSHRIVSASGSGSAALS
jgi:serine/threonine-protein kinase